MFEPCVVCQNDDFLEIKLPPFFRDKGWADGIQDVQSEISQYITRNTTKKRKILFNFNLCRWVDPLPLMSTLLEIANAQHLGLEVFIRLPEFDTSQNLSKFSPYHESPNRFLRFLAQEGFLECLDTLSDKGIHYFSKPEGGWDDYKNLNVKPSYEDAYCIPMRYFVVPKEGEDIEFAERTVESLLNGIDSKLTSKVASRALERLIYKLRILLQEMLHNVQEHAYDNDAALRSIAIYVRFRKSGLRLNSAGKKEYEEYIKEERNYCPMLSIDWLNVKPGCLEVFVLDRGIGMVKSFENSGHIFTHPFKFHEVIHNTFLDGHSTKQARRTRYGGLHLIHNLLKETTDYFRALEDGVWFGCSIPIIRPEKKDRDVIKDQKKMQGLAMHFRLGWKEETDHGNKWAEFKQGEGSEVWKELKRTENDCEPSFQWFENQMILDERFGESKTYGSKGDWILWLVKPHLMKRDIIDFIEKHIVSIASRNTILIIADIPSYEAETYAAALSEFKIDKRDDGWPAKISYIILSTNRWRFATVKYFENETKHGFSKLEENFTTLRIPPPPIEPKPQNIRLAIIRWLKWHDSQRLWEEVHQGRSMFIPEQIIWGEDEMGQTEVISGFLDFPLTTHNSLCSAIYRAVLSRILGVLPPNEISMFPIDRLAMTVLREIYDTEVYEPVPDSTKSRLALGSLLVSGATLKASTLGSFDLHFFIHHNSPLKGDNPSLLFWLPKDQITEAPPRLARIGKTATIAPKGWKSFEVPRFDENERCIGARDPEKTYQDWQNTCPVIIKAGHWSYEGRHDFLTLNIVSALEAAFLAKNELASFLVSRILPFIGINKTEIDPNWHRLLEDQRDNNTYQDDGLLVYRSHTISESIIRKLINILTPEGQKLALSRIFPILPIRMRWSGSSFLIPPLVREDIRIALHSGNQVRPVLLFDDITITGRTLNDLRTTLSAIGATQIKTVVIVNRLRQPIDGYGSERLDYYWRFDLPEMGRDGNCPLCHSLHLADSLYNLLASNNAKNEIYDWKQQWGETSTLNNWNGGLHPVPLKTIERKKYCYRYNKDAPMEEGKYLAEIDLIRSTGLAIHVAELHAMTGRDDYCLKKIKEYQEPEIRIELATSQLLLFGNEFDLDIRIELIQTLICELSKLEKGSPHASLAALTAMITLKLLDEEAKNKAIKMIQEGELVSKENYTIRVLYAYLVSEKLIYYGSDAYEIGKRLLSTSSLTLSQRFNAWFLETLSPHGNPHSGAITLLLNLLKQTTEIKNEQIQDALDSLDYLAEIIDEIVEGPEKNLRRRDALKNFENKITEMEESCQYAYDILIKKLSEEKVENWRESTKNALLDYITAMKDVANAFFHIIPSAQEYWRERTYEVKALNLTIAHINWHRASEGKFCNSKPINTSNRKIEISITGDIAFDSKTGEVWIAWHRDIEEIVMDLFRNAVYAKKQICDPWDNSQQQPADMWVRINYRAKLVELILVNASKDDSETVFSKLKKRWHSLEELGGSIEPYDELQNLVGIRVRIPYAAYFEPKK